MKRKQGIAQFLVKRKPGGGGDGSTSSQEQQVQDQDQDQDQDQSTSPSPPSPVLLDDADSTDESQSEGEHDGFNQQEASSDDIWKSRADGPVQPVLKMFPRTEQGDRKRGFKEASMITSTNKGREKKIAENRMYIKSLAEVLLLTAEVFEGSDDPDNFLALLGTLANHDPLIEKRLNGDAKYTSKNIQNEILETLAEMVQQEIINEVKQSEVFGVVAEETKEQMSFVVRYFYNGAIHESFLDFVKADQLDAAGLSSLIIECLEKRGLEYRNNLVGQGYDGAAVTSGEQSGVCSQIQQLAKYAFYVHSKAHCLNLVIVDSVKSVAEACCFSALMQKLHSFLSESYVNARWQAVQREMCGGRPRETPSLSDTGGACSYSACRDVLDGLPAVYRVLQEVGQENDGDRATDARGILPQLDVGFICVLVTFHKVLGQSRFLSDMLQSPSPDLAAAVALVESLLPTLQQYRSEACFEDVWKVVEETAVKCDLSFEPSNDDKDSFKKNLYYPVLDSVIGELQRRFSEPNCLIMKGIQALSPQSASFLEKETLTAFAKIFDSELEDLANEVAHVKMVLERKKQNGMKELTTLTDFVGFLEPFKDVFFELFRLGKIAVVTPVSSASCERSFSARAPIKNHLRNTVGDTRLSHSGLLSVEYRRAKSLDLDEFVKRFSTKHANRRIILF
ncbi:zinc finger MYM-type protein 1-like [Cololabis saira]|uniref:zinc finger MYM-type protein 1-like n=1 Tax=Cololabis saira TaxID=129043 RepID=UPI002AD3526E|nr:zinc finger MYM-type protein 1-like [Cololabis saira]XP_061589449.1 zinc finger MYM-type protein 1-like [Cololabis saira]